MILKLEAAKRAIEGGVREVRIVGGTGPDALLLALAFGRVSRCRRGPECSGNIDHARVAQHRAGGVFGGMMRTTGKKKAPIPGLAISQNKPEQKLYGAKG